MSAQIEISRDCDAMLIPSGTQVRLAKGTLVVITHRLGGNFTVSGSFGMARILEKDADAIGEASKNLQNSETKAEAEENVPSPAPEEKSDRENFAPPEESELWDAARTVYDPEIPLNIVDLGLVYKMDLIHSPDGKYAVEADMTLTAPGCAMGPVIADDLKMRLKAIPGIDDAVVNIVWDPPWHQDMISEEGKMTLGLL
ncbi:iron-sulfur cluster assembly protein [Intestinicryptomonas porci]|uniref:Iron-sulfur cluster assembly protein n=1 Tax=Intestinicryptomonas porci TaxID=2926320 RepID=A0ABU4WHV8_9BACT|nr:iron-sulfur cluster assembly protein [Opitutales bacterium CLA-KB-P66]